MSEQDIIKKKAIDITPYEYLYPCILVDKYAEIEIVNRKWSDDGVKICFMLGTHNFVSAEPDEELEVIPFRPKYCSDEFLEDARKKDRERMANRPASYQKEIDELQACIDKLEKKLKGCSITWSNK